MKTKSTKYTATRIWPEHAWQTDMPFPNDVLAAGEWRGDMKTGGMWNQIQSYKALAIEETEYDTSHYDRFPKTAVIYGWRELLNPRESGYELEGRVSIEGKKHRAFTSTMMFQVNGKLVDVAILYVCRKKVEVTSE